MTDADLLYDRAAVLSEMVNKRSCAIRHMLKDLSKVQNALVRMFSEMRFEPKTFQLESRSATQ